MAGKPVIQAIGPSNPLSDAKLGQRTVNMYLSASEAVGEGRPLVLKSAPWLSEVLADVNTQAGTPAASPIRGSWDADGRWFLVVYNRLLEVDLNNYPTMTYHVRGTLLTTTGFVSIKHGRDQLVLADGPYGYVMNLQTNVFGQITDPDWRGSNWVEEADGFFIFVDPNTDQFYISAIDDASNLDALDFSSADAQYDNIVTHRVINNELVLMGSRSCEFWINTGTADFPFARYKSATIDFGVVGNRAALKAGGALVWVAQEGRGSPFVVEMRGHQATRISTTAVEEALNSSTDISECSMWTYRKEGAEFASVSAPGMSTDWVFDFASRQWHERGKLEIGEWTPTGIDFVTYSPALGPIATRGAAVYRYTEDEPLDIDVGPHVRERTWPHLVSKSMEPVTYRGVEIHCTTGVPDPNGNVDGVITLEVSNDGGRTFQAPQLRSLGAAGRFMQRVRWLWQGSAIDRVFRLRCSSPVPLTIHAVNVDA